MNSCRALSDFELFDLMKSGNEEAFSEIYNRYWTFIYSHALRMLDNEDDAKDTTQEVFTLLWLNAPNIELTSSLAGYLYTSARHKVLNLIRHGKIQKEYLSSLEAWFAELNNSTQERVNLRDLEQALEREIQNLPSKMRQIFELSRKQDLSHRDIAVRLEISDKTVKKQISNALKIIRLRLGILAALISLINLILKA